MNAVRKSSQSWSVNLWSWNQSRASPSRKLLMRCFSSLLSVKPCTWKMLEACVSQRAASCGLTPVNGSMELTCDWKIRSRLGMIDGELAIVRCDCASGSSCVDVVFGGSDNDRVFAYSWSNVGFGGSSIDGAFADSWANVAFACWRVTTMHGSVKETRPSVDCASWWRIDDESASAPNVRERDERETRLSCEARKDEWIFIVDRPSTYLSPPPDTISGYPKDTNQRGERRGERTLATSEDEKSRRWLCLLRDSRLCSNGFCATGGFTQVDRAICLDHFTPPLNCCKTNDTVQVAKDLRRSVTIVVFWKCEVLHFFTFHLAEGKQFIETSVKIPILVKNWTAIRSKRDRVERIKVDRDIQKIQRPSLFMGHPLYGKL